MRNKCHAGGVFEPRQEGFGSANDGLSGIRTDFELPRVAIIARHTLFELPREFQAANLRNRSWNTDLGPANGNRAHSLKQGLPAFTQPAF